MENADLLSKYNELKIEIENFFKSFEAEIKESKEMISLYFGYQVLFSPLIHKPKFMFIGINPGKGYFNQNKRNVKRLSPLNHMEYLGLNYRLAKETDKLLKLSGYDSKEIFRYNSVKTNLFFIATKNQIDLSKILSKRPDAIEHHQKWIVKLIEMINPEFIICEGKFVFNELSKQLKAFGNKNGGVLFSESNGPKLIGYKRRFSFILNKEKIADLIRSKTDFSQKSFV